MMVKLAGTFIVASCPMASSPPLKRPVVWLLELHVTHACNLSCESCSHYSNHGHGGELSLAEAERWMLAWRDRIDVRQFNLLGGEPSIHPQLPEFIPLVRRHWPEAHVRVVTNGFFLFRHPGLPVALAAAGHADLCLSVHHGGEDYLRRLQPARDLLADWQRDHGIRVEIWESHAGWTARYRGRGAAMLPFEDGRPQDSWAICPAKWCKQLHDGKIWKCAPLAYLGMQKARYPQLSEQWDPYLRYVPLEANCSDEELRAFITRGVESACGMCPADRRPFTLPNPMRRSATQTPEA
jgi:hypothetical protein